MKFYHCFYTDLPDQFVAANSEKLVKWTDGWKDKNRYYRRSMMVDAVAIDFFGNAQNETWPRLKAQSKILIDRWMASKGAQYDGRYWESLTEDQRSPARISRDTGRDKGTTLTFTSATLTAAAIAAASRRILSGGGVVGWDMAEEPKSPLKRDGIVAGEIVGYRCWRVENGLLRSVYQPDVWHPGNPLQGRELDDWNNRGIHAWKDAGSKDYHQYVRGYLNRNLDPFVWALMHGGKDPDETRPAMVTGTVFLWGDVVEHERGYRAEFARVRSLDWLYPDASMMGREQATLDGLRAKYGANAVQGHFRTAKGASS